MSLPQPLVIMPGEASTEDRVGHPPSDAIVLFDGKDISAWRGVDGGPAKWIVQNGTLEVVPGARNIHTQQAFGDCQLHVEWATPNPPHGEGQGRGNSGVYLMSHYEIQVLDSYQNKTYPDGQAGALYAEYPPLVNAMRPPGQWQTYDILFRRPRFDKEGKVLRPAYVTVLHNGVLVLDHVAATGPTEDPGVYRAHPDKLPLLLQDHGQPVHFRNIWIRELPEEDDE